MTKALEVAHNVRLIRELAEYDHAFLKEEAVKHFTEPFGFTGVTYMAKANPQDFKGLSLFDDKGNPISEARGQAAHKVAMQICQHLGVPFMEMHGVGSQLRVCVARLLEHLTSKEKTTPSM